MRLASVFLRIATTRSTEFPSLKHREKKEDLPVHFHFGYGFRAVRALFPWDLSRAQSFWELNGKSEVGRRRK